MSSALGEERQAQPVRVSVRARRGSATRSRNALPHELKFTATSSSSSVYFSYNSVVAGTIKINYTL